MRKLYFTAIAFALMAGAPLVTRAQDGSGGQSASSAEQSVSDAAQSSADSAQSSASSATGDAQSSADNAMDNDRSSANQGSNNAQSTPNKQSAANDAYDNAQQTANDASDQSQQATDQQRQSISDDRSSDRDRNRGEYRDQRGDNRDQRRDDAWNRDQRDGNLRDQRRFSDRERTAPWRFVQNNGVWWYRTPMNTWMVQRDGRWRPYAHTAGYRGGQRGQTDHAFGNQPYAEQPANYQQQPGQHGVQTTSYQGQPAQTGGGQHARVGTTEWMCIDGRMRRVTVTSVSSAQSSSQGSQGQSQGEEPAPTPADAGGQSDDGLSPPPVPQPNGSNSGQNRDVPEAPSRDRMMDTSSNSGSNAQRQNTRKPVTSYDAAAPAEPRSRTMQQDTDLQTFDARGYQSDDRLGGPSDGLDNVDSYGGDAAPERR